MVQLITSSARVQECVAALEQSTEERVHGCGSLKAALKLLRTNEYDAIVIDEWLLEADADGADLVMAESGSATAVMINFAISSIERLVRDVRAALRRRQRELQAATRKAESALRSELNEALTGILLSSQLTGDSAGVPPALQAKMRSIYQLAMTMRERLQPAH